MQSRQSLFNKKKQKKWPYILSGSIVGVLIVVIVAWLGLNNWNIEKSIAALGLATKTEDSSKEETSHETKEEEQVEENPVEETPVVETPKENEPEIDLSGAKGYIGHETLPEEPTFVNGLVIASKKYPLPSTYAPGESKEARAAFGEMAAEAKLSGYELVAFSTYRSFDYQVKLYDKYVNNDGKDAADRYSARPGYSEHQTGLAFDIGEQHFEQHFARESFGETDAGKWIAANAHKYGFVMRYPQGKEKITGYMYEPWHFRYIGEQFAGEIYEANSTIEEFFDM